jgi:predicted NAD-dependent protein-ADP-ribosyltransferase YbiA (DUF1768 family)
MARAVLISGRKAHAKYGRLDPFFEFPFVFRDKQYNSIRVAFWSIEAEYHAKHSKHPDRDFNWKYAEMIRVSPDRKTAYKWYQMVIFNEGEKSPPEVKDKLIHDLIWARFNQDKEALALLAETDGKWLGLASKTDVWGTGCDDNEVDHTKWRRDWNKYGRALGHYRKSYMLSLRKATM